MAVDVITSYSKYSWDSSDRIAGNLPGFGDNSDITPRLHDTGFERDAESGEEYYTYNGTAWVKRNIPAIKLSGSNLADETDKAATANTDILTDITATKTMMTTLMVATSAEGILSLEVDAKLASLNGGVALTANQWYAFDIPILAASVYNLKLSVNATMQIKWIGGF